MKKFFVIWALMASACLADRPIFLITPAGVYQSIVDATGKPGPWVPLAADVIVQGFGNTPPLPPDPPSNDPVVTQIAAISKSVLKDKEDATAVAAIIDSIVRLIKDKYDDPSGEITDPEKKKLFEIDFKQAMEMSAPIADASLGANGRITSWTKQALAVTSDPAKLKAGVISAFGVAQETLDSIHAAASNPGAAVTGEAINWTQLIAIIQMILTLLKNLGIGV